MVLTTRWVASETEARIMLVEGRAIGADSVFAVAHVDEHVRMVERRQCARAHKFPHADAYRRHAEIIVKMRRADQGCHKMMSVKFREPRRGDCIVSPEA